MIEKINDRTENFCDWFSKVLAWIAIPAAVIWIIIPALFR